MIMEQYKEIKKKEKAALLKYRIHVARHNKWPWILLAVSLLLPLITLLFPTNGSVVCKIINYVESFSFGLLSGLVVYIFVTFFPETKKQAKAIDAIYFQLYLISQHLNTIYYKFAPEKSKIDFRVFQTLLYNFLVKDAHIVDYANKEQSSERLFVNMNSYNYLNKTFTLLNSYISILVTSYNQFLNSGDVEVLLKMAQLKSCLTDSIFNDGMMNADYLDVFISDYTTLYCFHFQQMLRKYERFKSWEPTESLKS